jgi:hypothetical protein
MIVKEASNPSLERGCLVRPTDGTGTLRYAKKVHSVYFSTRPIALCARHPMSSGTSKHRLVRELPKNADLPKSPLLAVAALVPSAGATTTTNRVAFGADAPQHPASGACPHAERRAFRLIEGGENESSFNAARNPRHASLARRGRGALS